jgi:hypothetical protein
MKLSKSLLQVIAVAVSVSVAGSSCTKIEENYQEKKTEIKEKCNIPTGKTTTPGFDCAACGMG